MSVLVSRAPRPALSEHPEFAMMLAFTLERYRCTLAEIKEDYWLGRAWRALANDPELDGRVARVGVGHVLVTGPHGSSISNGRERMRLRQSVLNRLEVDTGHTGYELGLSVRFADAPVEVAQGSILSLLSQTVAGDARWHDLTPYAADLSPVMLPVASTEEAFVAA